MKRLYEPLAYDTTKSVKSWWQQSGVEQNKFLALEKDIQCETVIIGGGFTGLNAALQLAERHQTEAVILEAGQIGWGASGRNGGFACLGGAKLTRTAQIKRFGLEETKHFAARQKEAVARVHDNLTRYEISADTHSRGEMQLAHRLKNFEEMKTEAAIEKAQLGFDSVPVEHGELRDHGIAGPEFFGGVLNSTGFALNPLKYVQGLAKAANNLGVKIFCETPVSAIKQTRNGYVLCTANARVTAKKLIIATNGYSSDDLPKPLGGRFLPLLSTILVTRPITQEEQAAQGWTSDLMSYDSRNLLHYFRLMPDGRFLFGRRGAIRANAASMERADLGNRRDFERMFPAWRKIGTDYKWSGLLCLTRNLHPYIGPIEGMDSAYAALGYHGNGVAMASLSGRLVADISIGETPDLPPHLSTPLKRFPVPSLRRWALAGAFVQYRLQDWL